ncbi:hypothetical protein Tsubulata_007956 [Turnera subulata]|uniref:C3H1-type domain-containing protein n=1 Tax=Turnera subulata TaxID=218843 RepID=A0A9Q0JJZ9_9ROSI|nr:hypothetical protein Tsubulata_007956 [Turnera subulata]
MPRGSCQWGARCKYVHANPQQQQHQQQLNQKPNSSPNPFGFGVHSSANNNNNYKQPQQFKAFENKWTRNFTPLSSNSAAAPSSKQSDSQSQSSNHKCTDPDACKSVITEDFQRERPNWRLTCYGHLKNGPCDILGDISYEELRFAAYEDSKRGLSLQSIVERERNLLNSKLMEFENLLGNPYKARSNSNLAAHGPFPVATPNAFPANGQSGGPPTVSSFGQLGPLHHLIITASGSQVPSQILALVQIPEEAPPDEFIR